MTSPIYNGSIDEGIEIKINKVKAFKYYLMAAKNKFIPALITVSDMYGNGIGTKKDPKKSYEYLKLVSKSNNDNLIDIQARHFPFPCPGRKLKYKRVL